jgi:hypothetical protein
MTECQNVSFPVLWIPMCGYVCYTSGEEDPPRDLTFSGSRVPITLSEEGVIRTRDRVPKKDLVGS